MFRVFRSYAINTLLWVIAVVLAVATLVGIFYFVVEGIYRAFNGRVVEGIQFFAIGVTLIAVAGGVVRVVIAALNRRHEIWSRACEGIDYVRNRDKFQYKYTVWNDEWWHDNEWIREECQRVNDEDKRDY